MNKEFIPYEQALELKELGFDEPCLAWTIPGQPTPIMSYCEKYMDRYDKMVQIPLFQQAFRWFREYHGIFIQPNKTIDREGVWYYFSAHTKRTEVFEGSFKYEVAELECLKGLIRLLNAKK